MEPPQLQGARLAPRDAAGRGAVQQEELPDHQAGCGAARGAAGRRCRRGQGSDFAPCLAGDGVDFLSWFLNALHSALGGTKKKKKSERGVLGGVASPHGGSRPRVVLATPFLSWGWPLTSPFRARSHRHRRFPRLHAHLHQKAASPRPGECPLGLGGASHRPPPAPR